MYVTLQISALLREVKQGPRQARFYATQHCFSPRTSLTAKEPQQKPCLVTHAQADLHSASFFYSSEPPA